MLSLIIKDIVIQKRMIPFTLLYVVVFIILTAGNYNKGSVYIIGVTVAFMFSLGAIQYDEKCKADNIIASLPLKRKDIIISRYLGTIFFTAASTLFITMFVWLINFINIKSVNISAMNINDIKIIAITTLVMMSVIIPLNLKFGINKAKIITFALYFTFFTIALSIYNNVNEEPIRTIYLFFIKNGLFLAILLFAVSFVFSIFIYENKDFA